MEMRVFAFVLSCKLWTYFETEGKRYSEKAYYIYPGHQLTSKRVPARTPVSSHTSRMAVSSGPSCRTIAQKKNETKTNNIFL